jgi:hypothetical protein
MGSRSILAKARKEFFDSLSDVSSCIQSPDDNIGTAIPANKRQCINLEDSSGETAAESDGLDFGFCVEEEETYFDAIADFNEVLENLQFETDAHADIEEPPIQTSSPNPLSLSEELLLFFIIFNISHAAMSYLLKLLVRHNIAVPPTLYQLKKMQKNFDWNILNINNGQFAYLSIKENIVYCLDNGMLSISKSINQVILNIKISIDGLPLYKSSNMNLWPILCSIQGVARPLPLGILCGIGKPDLNTMLVNLCTEIHALRELGSEKNYFFTLLNFCMKRIPLQYCILL